MNARLQETIQQLEDAGFEYETHDFGGPVRRTVDVIDEKGLDIDPEHIVKTIMFKSKEHGPFCVSVFGSDRVSYQKLRDHFGDNRISILDPDTMKDMGWEPGECCPLSVPGPLLVDPSVFEIEWINAGSGDLQYGLSFPSEAIKRLRDDVAIVDVRE